MKSITSTISRLLCKRPCTQTTYEVQQEQKELSSELEIELEFETEVDVTRVKHSLSLWDVVTGLGGAVRL